MIGAFLEKALTQDIFDALQISFWTKTGKDIFSFLSNLLKDHAYVSMSYDRNPAYFQIFQWLRAEHVHGV